jgi:hypothetical protein
MVKNKHALAATDYVQREKGKKCLGAEVPTQWRRARQVLSHGPINVTKSHVG